MRFYTVREQFTSYLQQIDRKVPNNNYATNQKPYIGIVLEMNGIKYLAPLSSKKPWHPQVKEGDILYQKIFDGSNPSNFTGMVMLRYMIPVLDSEIEVLDFNTQEARYKNLLQRQYSYLKPKKQDIERKAYKLYQMVVVKGVSHFCNKCCDFRALEESLSRYTP